MAEIKTAFEKAMERYQDIAPDKHALRKKEYIEKGRTFFAQKLQGENTNIHQILESEESEAQKWIKKGLGDALLGHITLPSSEAFVTNINAIKEIVSDIATQTDMAIQLLDQYQEVCIEFLERKTEMNTQMKQQYMKIMQQQGQSQALEANFIQSMQNQLKQLDEQYAPTIEQVKNNLQQLCGFTDL